VNSGEPGLGKTLTAEAVAEYRKKALYSVCFTFLHPLIPGLTVQISAGELSTDAAKLEVQLSRIFKIVSHWNAILLLDEADVFLEQRSSDLIRNSLVSVFLRKLEYCEGILFLTTNRVAQFDKAILSRIHVMLRYGDLSKVAGKKVWELFMKTSNTSQGPPRINADELKRLVNCKLNGRLVRDFYGIPTVPLADNRFQIKNVMATAHALAKKEKSRVCFSHIRRTVTASKEFITEFNGGVEVSNLYL
jgi:SpoVK/Ycf46/Vps4 family AAA+-type ATPase